MSGATADRPRAQRVDVDSIPAALKDVPQWVVWRYTEEIDPETGEVDYDKPPVNARTGGLASSTNPQTWTTYEQAAGAYQRGGLDGIGFVLRRDKAAGDAPGLVAIDLDKCRDPETGTIEPWATSIVHSINTYTEVSPSGRGLRLFLYGKLPGHGRKRGPYENYEAGRYVTVTGQRIEGAPATIEHRQAELLRVHAEQWGGPPKEQTAGGTPNGHVYLGVTVEDVVRKASEAKNGQKFKALWAGSINGYPSQSEADQALVNYLAFWCGAEELIDASFRQSGLFRSKWNRDYYRKRTISRALESCKEFFDWEREHRKRSPRPGQ
jgi:primase-polymerase (primpol)-like protein